MTHFEHDLYEGDLPPAEWQARWWQYVARYQGVQAPAAARRRAVRRLHQDPHQRRSGAVLRLRARQPHQVPAPRPHLRARSSSRTSAPATTRAAPRSDGSCRASCRSAPPATGARSCAKRPASDLAARDAGLLPAPGRRAREAQRRQGLQPMKVLKQFFWFLMFLVMLAAAAAGGYAVYLERQDREEIDKLRKEMAAFDPRFEKFKAAVGDLSKGFTSLVLDEVDLTRSGWQPIGKGFYLIDVAVISLLMNEPNLHINIFYLYL